MVARLIALTYRRFHCVLHSRQLGHYAVKRVRLAHDGAQGDIAPMFDTLIRRCRSAWAPWQEQLQALRLWPVHAQTVEHLACERNKVAGPRGRKRTRSLTDDIIYRELLVAACPRYSEFMRRRT
jgi:hypothetical protein